MWIAGLDEAQAGIKVARRNINNLRYADDNTFMAESQEELRSLSMKVKEESKKSACNVGVPGLIPGSERSPGEGNGYPCQLELDMEQQTYSKLEKEYIKAVYCHPAYLTYM